MGRLIPAGTGVPTVSRDGNPRARWRRSAAEEEPAPVVVGAIEG